MLAAVKVARLNVGQKPRLCPRINSKKISVKVCRSRATRQPQESWRFRGTIYSPIGELVSIANDAAHLTRYRLRLKRCKIPSGPARTCSCTQYEESALSGDGPVTFSARIPGAF